MAQPAWAPVEYKKPQYLIEATKQKYGRRVKVTGALQDDLDAFWDNVYYQAVEIGQRPKEVSRSIVDIDCKVHVNNGKEEDEVEITSAKTSQAAKKRSYKLSLGKSWKFTAGASIGLKASYFNVVGGGMSGEASVSRKKSKEEEFFEENEETLSQKYGVVEKLKVAPEGKVKVVITTYAVTYELKSQTQIKVEADLVIPVRYKSPLLGCGTVGYLTSHDIFRDENPRNVDGVLHIFKDSTISHIGEEVELIKEV